MSVRDIMNTKPLTVGLGDTFGSAFALMLERHTRCLPVVDEQGVYHGMFDIYDVWEVLLPRAVVTGSDSSIPDLSFMASNPGRLHRKILEASGRPVTDFLRDRASPRVSPDAPASEAVFLLYRHGGNLPVVEKDTGRLVGLVTPWDILQAAR